jgi:hypothetical protein
MNGHSLTPGSKPLKVKLAKERGKLEKKLKNQAKRTPISQEK